MTGVIILLMTLNQVCICLEMMNNKIIKCLGGGGVSGDLDQIEKIN